MTGFSPRKRELTLYIMAGFERHGALMRKLGKYKTGKCCLYLKRLADVDLDVLERLIRESSRPARFGDFLLLCALVCMASTACALRPAGPHPGSGSAAEARSQPPIPREGTLPAAGLGLTNPPRNPWSDFTREVLVQHCGSCHRGDLPTRVPRALAVFDLLEEPWYGRFTADQLDELLRRVRAIDGLPASDAESVGSFVRCARDGVCESHPTEGR